jgi:hypothetical protein
VAAFAGDLLEAAALGRGGTPAALVALYRPDPTTASGASVSCPFLLPSKTNGMAGCGNSFFFEFGMGDFYAAVEGNPRTGGVSEEELLQMFQQASVL